MYWISSEKKKRHLRRINKLIREMNKQIKEDNLWQGRFTCKLVGCPQWVKYTDGSGGRLYCRCEFEDSQTGFRKTSMWVSTNDLSMGINNIWMLMNDFIIRCVYGQ